MRLGLDFGKVFTKGVVIDKYNNIVKKWFLRHQGEVGNSLETILNELNHENIHVSAFGLTGSFSELFSGDGKGEKIDDVNALITAANYFSPSARNIINIGGSSLMLIELSENGEFLNMTCNSLCAAGTGSFLDQQALRLGINDNGLAEHTMMLSPPEVATRCAVFAKTDIIHRQQEGFSKSEIWCGLCKGLSLTMLNTLLKGRKIHGDVLLTGGVAMNSLIQHYLRTILNEKLIVSENPHLLQAFGAALLGNLEFKNLRNFIQGRGTSRKNNDKKLMPSLNLELSKHFSFDNDNFFVDSNGTEVRVSKITGKNSPECFIGIDIGSTSTKSALIDREGKVIADFYRKTDGDPIGATKKIFQAIQEFQERDGIDMKILGTATTGSGRKMLGQLIGADAIVNEITAHATGALHFNPDIETIFEIGGQDSKYIHLKNGRVHLVNMNYVCAAGTGSFIEEQAVRLGFDVRQIGKMVLGIQPPITSDRCTVFMEEDLNRLLRQGYSKKEVMAAVMYSVVQNYLNKVVGNRPVSKQKIFFQGATARNVGLVAAFEKYLKREIIVNPSCHIMGALGAALIARNKILSEGRKTTFRGLNVFKNEIKLTWDTCNICSNVCRITYAEISGFKEKPSWGYMCGREPEEKKAKYKEYYDLFEFREKLLLTVGGAVRKTKPLGTAGIPWVMTNYTYMPLWRTFLNELGFNVRMSPKTNDEILKAGIESVQADMCLPVKVVYGHVNYLSKINDVNFIFLPHLIGGKKNKDTSNSCFCPYVQAVPSMLRAGSDTGKNLKPIVSPVVDFRESISSTVKNLFAVFKDFGISEQMIRKAFKKGMEAQNKFSEALQQKGREVLEELKKDQNKAMVIVGRPYNVYDSRVNLNIPKKIAGLGFRVIPLDMIPFNSENLGEEFYNMFWNYGQVIINALKVIRDYGNVFPVYLTNFSCGPDSFLLTYAEEISDKKPLLILELDEHGADAGYSTRIEAFVDSIESYVHNDERFSIYSPKVNRDELRDRKWLIPPMHPIGARLVAAAMRGHGLNAVSLPDETADVHSIGKSLTRGGECVPASLTIGNIVKYMQENKNSEKFAVFMPTSTGPCRFGQYATLHRIILNKSGYADVPVISPSAENAYYGLDMELRKDIWKAILSGDILYKIRCKLKPYEEKGGEAERKMNEAFRVMEACFENRGDYLVFLEKAVRNFDKIKTKKITKPLVGVVGEIFVRCNPFSNGYVVESIERYGGEAWLAPVSEWIQYTAYLHKLTAIDAMKWNEIFKAFFKNRFIVREEHRAYEVVEQWLHDRKEPPIDLVVNEGARYLPREFTAEAILTIGRAVVFMKQNASLIVNASPFTCMPGNISAAIFQKIQKEYGVPVINLFYDGDHSENERLRSFMSNIRVKKEDGARALVG
jgi:predicted CoA-substrate-specific enzyme activase